ncbi:MAG: hypothetical protein Kow0080_16440 [Candidatus Promineifilaceae bacterium]
MTHHTLTHSRLFHLWIILRHELVFMVWALMELTLLVPLALAFMPWSQWSPLWMIVVLFGLMFVPVALGRLLKWLNLPKETQQKISLLAAFLAMIVAVRVVVYDLPSPFSLTWIGQFFRNAAESGNNLWQRDVQTAVLTGIVWWRGLVLAGREPDVHLLRGRLQRGALVLAPLTAVIGYWQLEWSVLPYILLYFGLALTGVYLTRIEQTERDHNATYANYTPWLIGSIAALSLGTVSLPGLTALFLTENSEKAVGWLQAPYQAIRFGFAVTAVTIAKLAAPFTSIFDTIFNAIANLIRTLWQRFLVAYTPPEQSDVRPPANEELIESLTRNVRSLNINPRIFLYVFISFVFLIMLLIIWYAFRTSTGTVSSSRFNRIVGGLASRVTGIEPNRNGRKPKRDNWLKNWRMALSIRRIYQRLVYEAEQLGFPRDETVTPYEFLPTLLAIWPHHEQELSLITQAYVRIRYGEAPESQDELHQIEAAWSRIETAVPEKTAVSTSHQ